MRPPAVQEMQRDDRRMPDLPRRSEGNTQGIPVAAGCGGDGGWYGGMIVTVTGHETS